MATKKTEELKRKKSAIKATLADKAVKKSTKKKVDESKLVPIESKMKKGTPLNADQLRQGNRMRMIEKETGHKIAAKSTAKAMERNYQNKHNGLVPIESVSDTKKRLMVEKYTNGRMTYVPEEYRKK